MNASIIHPMLTRHVFGLALALGLLPARAALYNFPATVNQLIPDNNASGHASTIAVSGLPSDAISAVRVRLNVSGGWNGDLYVTLVHNQSATAILLNRIGVNGAGEDGFNGAGFDIWLSDSGANGDVHVLGSGAVPLTGNWQPDGRLADPDSVTFGSPRGGMLNVFNGANPNGSWTLFVADVSPVHQSTLVSWELEIQAVPEPVSVALSLFGVGAAAWLAFQRWKNRSAV